MKSKKVDLVRAVWALAVAMMIATIPTPAQAQPVVCRRVPFAAFYAVSVEGISQESVPACLAGTVRPANQVFTSWAVTPTRLAHLGRIDSRLRTSVTRVALPSPAEVALANHSALIARCEVPSDRGRRHIVTLSRGDIRRHPWRPLAWFPASRCAGRRSIEIRPANAVMVSRIDRSQAVTAAARALALAVVNNNRSAIPPAARSLQSRLHEAGSARPSSAMLFSIASAALNALAAVTSTTLPPPSGAGLDQAQLVRLTVELRRLRRENSSLNSSLRELRTHARERAKGDWPIRFLILILGIIIGWCFSVGTRSPKQWIEKGRRSVFEMATKNGGTVRRSEFGFVLVRNDEAAKAIEDATLWKDAHAVLERDNSLLREENSRLKNDAPTGAVSGSFQEFSQKFLDPAHFAITATASVVCGLDPSAFGSNTTPLGERMDLVAEYLAGRLADLRDAHAQVEDGAIILLLPGCGTRRDSVADRIKLLCAGANVAIGRASAEPVLRKPSNLPSIKATFGTGSRNTPQAFPPPAADEAASAGGSSPDLRRVKSLEAIVEQPEHDQKHVLDWLGGMIRMLDATIKGSSSDGGDTFGLEDTTVHSAMPSVRVASAIGSRPSLSPEKPTIDIFMERLEEMLHTLCNRVVEQKACIDTISTVGISSRGDPRRPAPGGRVSTARSLIPPPPGSTDNVASGDVLANPKGSPWTEPLK